MNINGLLYDEESSRRFDFNKLRAYPIEFYLSPQDIQSLNNIATSVKWQSNINKKYKAMDDIMAKRGFKKYACGTNRRIYRFMEDDSILFKVAYDRVGIEDNPKEYINQKFLQPYVAKMFQTTECGTIGCVERLVPFKHRYEFESVAGDIFDLLFKKILGVYILDDIGTNSFMNYGIRQGFGPCLLDYPYLYEVDLDKLVCKNRLPNGNICHGYIDYDIGFNKLVCEKCGKTYTASSIGKLPDIKLKNSPIIEETSSDANKFRYKIIKDKKVIIDHSHKESDIIY